MHKDTPRILFLTTFYPTKDRIHHGIFFRDHAEALATRYKTAVLHVDVYSWNQYKTTAQRTEHYEKNGVFTIHSISATPTHRLRNWTENQRKKAVETGYKQLVELWGKPDVVIAECSLPTGELALYLHNKKGIKYGLIEHFSFLEKQIQQQKAQMIPVYEQACFIGTVNRGLKKLLEREFAKPIHHFSNVIGQEFSLDQNISQQVEKKDSFKWLHVSYDDPKKGTHLLEQVLLHRPNIHLTLVGQGLERFLSTSRPNLRHIPTADRTAMLHLFRQHQGLVSLSTIETFGMVIVEALACGLPVVTTKSGGPQQYWEEFYGYETDFDATSVLENMQKLENEYKTINSEQLSSSILSKFGTQAFCNQLEPLLRACL